MKRPPTIAVDEAPARIVTPEQQLWSDVAMRAWEDYFSFDAGYVSSAAPTKTEREEAERFLFAASGGWARSRRDVCWAAGIDPDAFRQKALAKRDANDI